MKTLSLLSVLALYGGVAGAQQAPAPYDPYQQPDQTQSDDEYDDQTSDPESMQPVDPYDNEGSQAEAGEQDDGDYDDGYDPDAYRQFETQLAPYGEWVEDPSFGRVWEPSAAVVGADFSPYGTGGNWTLTEYGWTWVSVWDWGWAPFHYGRWIVRPHGWCWVPGTIWGPGWVSWRSGRGLVGWAPLRPRGLRAHDFRGSHRGWRFTAAAQLGHPGMRYVSPRSVRTILPSTRVIHNQRAMTVSGTAVRFNAGPRSGSARPVPLAQSATRALPRYQVTPRVGGTPAQRPWQAPCGADRPGYQQPQRRYTPQPPMTPQAPSRTYSPGNRAPGGNIYRGPSAPVNRPAPVYRGPSGQVVRPSAPVYRSVPANRPSAPAYRPAPSYRAPSAPAYRAPSAPAYRGPSAPSGVGGRSHSYRR
jgi:hypothetical protein